MFVYDRINTKLVDAKAKRRALCYHKQHKSGESLASLHLVNSSLHLYQSNTEGPLCQAVFFTTCFEMEDKVDSIAKKPPPPPTTSLWPSCPLVPLAHRDLFLESQGLSLSINRFLTLWIPLILEKSVLGGGRRRLMTRLGTVTRLNTGPFLLRHESKSTYKGENGKTKLAGIPFISIPTNLFTLAVNLQGMQTTVVQKAKSKSVQHFYHQILGVAVVVFFFHPSSVRLMQMLTSHYMQYFVGTLWKTHCNNSDT